MILKRCAPESCNCCALSSHAILKSLGMQGLTCGSRARFVCEATPGKRWARCCLQCTKPNPPPCQSTLAVVRVIRILNHSCPPLSFCWPQASTENLQATLPPWGVRAGAREKIYFEPSQVCGWVYVCMRARVRAYVRL